MLQAEVQGVVSLPGNDLVSMFPGGVVVVDDDAWPAWQAKAHWLLATV